MAANWLAEINLMPAFPLDGGRIYRLLPSHVRPSADSLRGIAAPGMLIGMQIAMQKYEIYQFPARGEMG